MLRCGEREEKKDRSNRDACDPRDLTEASLTVEAAFALPLFLFAILSLLYFIQIFTLQEYIQASLTRVGLNMAKTAYVYQEFAGMEDALNFDETIFGTEIEIGLGDFTKALVDQTILECAAKKYLDVDWINASCIRDGFDGISFYSSGVLKEENIIDIIVRYHIVLPIKLFSFQDLRMIQRVRVRAWTGLTVEPNYSVEDEGEQKEQMVYITETGRVYHLSANCSHIDLSITSIQGLPTTQRNTSGAKYYPCESCCKGKSEPYATYYITIDGTRYHSIRECSRIKRNIKEIPISQVGSRPACKRCGKKGKEQIE